MNTEVAMPVLRSTDSYSASVICFCLYFSLDDGAHFHDPCFESSLKLLLQYCHFASKLFGVLISLHIM